MKFSELLGQGKFLIGMSHMPPVSEGIGSWFYAAERNAEALAEGGITSIILENDGDKDIVANPKFISDVKRLALVHRYITEACQMLRRKYGDKHTIGVQILWNDWSSIMVAKEAGADFIRSQLYWESRIAPDSTVLEPVYAPVTAFKQLHSLDIAVLADINSKGTKPAGNYSREGSIADLLGSVYKPDALVVTGSATGKAPGVKSVSEFCNEVGRNAPGFPVGGGSGLTSENIGLLTNTRARFWIVGSWLKTNGYVDSRKASELTANLKSGAGLVYAMRP